MTQPGLSSYFFSMASGTGSRGILQIEDALRRCTNLILPFLIHQSPLLSCTKFSFLSVDTSANARPVNEAKMKISRTKAGRGIVNSLFIMVCNSSYVRNTGSVYFISVKRIFLHPSFSQCHICDLFETFHIADNGVTTQTCFCF